MQDTEMALAEGEMIICSTFGAKSFGDGSKDIRKDKERNLGPFSGFSD